MNATCGGAVLVFRGDSTASGTGGGRLGVLAQAGTALNVSSFLVKGLLEAEEQLPVPLLATEAVAGAGTLSPGWRTDVTRRGWLEIRTH